MPHLTPRLPRGQVPQTTARVPLRPSLIAWCRANAASWKDEAISEMRRASEEAGWARRESNDVRSAAGWAAARRHEQAAQAAFEAWERWEPSSRWHEQRPR